MGPRRAARRRAFLAQHVFSHCCTNSFVHFFGWKAYECRRSRMVSELARAPSTPQRTNSPHSAWGWAELANVDPKSRSIGKQIAPLQTLQDSAFVVGPVALVPGRRCHLPGSYRNSMSARRNTGCGRWCNTGLEDRTQSHLCLIQGA